MTNLEDSPTYSEQFIDWALSCGLADLPEAVQANIAERLLDHFGLCLVGGVFGFGDRARGGLSQAFGADGHGTRSQSTIVGVAGKHPAAVSAFTNAVNAHAHDFDDTHLEAVAHVSSVVLSTALAVAEQQETSWADFLVSAAAGYELMIRLGLIAPAHLVSHGFHPTSINGTLGSALAASRLRNASRDQALDALGIAGSLASGILQTVVEGTDTKRLHPGWAALCGIVSTEFSAASFSGPREIIEGRMGLVSTHMGDPADFALERLIDSLGQRWELLATVTKPFPCCHLNHAFIESAFDLRARSDFAVEELASVTCYIARDAASLICEPWEHKSRPRDPYEAKFSLPYSVAAALVDGEITVGTYTAEGIAREDLASVIRLVRYEIDEDSTFPEHFPGKIHVSFRDGTENYSETLDNLGGLERPLTREQIVDKFTRNASACGLRESYVGDVVKTLFSMRGDDSISVLMECLAIS